MKTIFQYLLVVNCSVWSFHDFFVESKTNICHQPFRFALIFFGPQQGDFFCYSNEAFEDAVKKKKRKKTVQGQFNESEGPRNRGEQRETDLERR